MNITSATVRDCGPQKSGIIAAEALGAEKNGKVPAESILDRITLKGHPNIRKGDATNDSVTLGANIAEHLKNSPLFEKLNGVIASALVVSGLKTIYSGVKEKDREKFLLGSKQTMWGTYHGLNTLETVLKASFSITPGLRAVGGFINADLGLTALYRDFKKEGKADADKVIFHLGATAWGFRHLSLGVEGLAKSQWAHHSLAGKMPGADSLIKNASAIGVAGAVMGVAGGALDALLGIRMLTRGIQTKDREKKILGILDTGIGVAMGASSVLTGTVAAAVIGTASLGIVYRTWRTDKAEIKKYIRLTKDTIKDISHKAKDKFKEIFRNQENQGPPPRAGSLTTFYCDGSAIYVQ